MQVVECSEPKAESPLSQGPRPDFAKTLYTLSVCTQTQVSNGTPLQYSCLENPVDGGAWWAAVHGVAGVGHD